MGRSSSGGGKGGRSFPQKTRGNMKQASASIKMKQFQPLSSDNKMKCSYEDCEPHFIDTIQVLGMRCVDDMVQSIRDKKLINLVSEKPVMQVSTKRILMKRLLKSTNSRSTTLQLKKNKATERGISKRINRF